MLFGFFKNGASNSQKQRIFAGLWYGCGVDCSSFVKAQAFLVSSRNDGTPVGSYNCDIIFGEPEHYSQFVILTFEPE